MGLEFSIDRASLAKARGHLYEWRQPELGVTLRKASLEGARVLRGPLREAAPTSKSAPATPPRDLRESIKLARLKDRSGYAAGPMGSLAFHRYWVVGGTGAHVIAGRGGGRVATPYGVFRQVHHPAVRANPFVARVGERYGGAVRAAMLGYMKQRAK